MTYVLSCSFHLALLVLAVARSESQEPLVTARDAPLLREGVRRVGFHRAQNKALAEQLDATATAVRRVGVAAIGQVGKDVATERAEVALKPKQSGSAALAEATNSSLPQVRKIQAVMVARGQSKSGDDGGSVKAVHVQREVHQGSMVRRISSSIARLFARGAAKHTRASRMAQPPGWPPPYPGYPPPQPPSPYASMTTFPPWGGAAYGLMTTTGWPQPGLYGETTAAPAYSADGQIAEEEDDNPMTTIIIVVAFAILLGALGMYLYRIWLTRQAIENLPDTRGRLATDFHRDKFGDDAADAINDAKKNKSKYTRSDIQANMQNNHTDSEGEEEAPNSPGPRMSKASSTGGSEEQFQKRKDSPTQLKPQLQPRGFDPASSAPLAASPGAQFSRGLQRSSEVGPARVNVTAGQGRGVGMHRAHASFVHSGLHGKR